MSPRILSKRLLDLTVGLFILFWLWPIMIVVALLVRFRMGSPVLFRQQRPGWQGHPFFLYKFRTMNDRRDPEGQYLPDSERLTTLGRQLRRFSLDELPQLLNVLKGDMSLVGPRPLLLVYLERYTPEQARRHEVKPGITGWAQINGRNAVSWEERFMMDVWYVDHQSLWLDARILLLTVAKVLRPEGVAAEGHVTMPEFKGSGKASI